MRVPHHLIPLRHVITLGVIGLPLAGRLVRKPGGPLPVSLIPALRPAADSPLVIVLPGIGDDLGDLRASGIAATIQRGWPCADVLLVGASLGYYLQGGVARRLHDEIVLPARARGYRNIWLAGASMGGMGALLYERRYPGEVNGLALLAPHMGDTRTVKNIAAAGGPRRWNPGPLPVTINKENYQMEIWRVVHGWALHPETAQHVWLAAGSRDRLLPAARLMAPLLPPGHFLEARGGHSWKVWNAAAAEIFTQLAAHSALAYENQEAGPIKMLDGGSQ